MGEYQYSPYAHVIESHLIPDTIQYGVFHHLTGYIIEPNERIRALLFASRMGHHISFADDDLNKLPADGRQIRKLIEQRFLIPVGCDPLASFLDYFVVRPVQNPALAYRDRRGEVKLVRTSMTQRIYSPRKGELPAIVEESMPSAPASVFLEADGTKTLRELFELAGLDDDAGRRETIDFLTSPKRQLIKLTADASDLADPYQPCNTVPRNFYHASRWNPGPKSDAPPIVDFHVRGIEDASWEFDLIEPTINHAFRFSSEALGGLDYGARFCVATLKPEVLPSLVYSRRLEILEVGGGTGSFARSFMEQTRSLTSSREPLVINYEIMDLSPALIRSQRETLAGVVPPVTHSQQDATSLDLPGRKFDLIIANEVIADFPVAPVWRARHGATLEASQVWQGEGACYVEKYGLDLIGAPDSFLVNAGVFRFIERAWEHLSPGGAVIMSEYGSVDRFPAQSYHLNHEEFSIHFGHLQACARAIGFACRLLKLKEFLGVDDRVSMLDGQEEQIQCLNYVFQKHGVSLPYALISRKEFKQRFGLLAERIGLAGVSFSPLRSGFHFGPKIDEFMILIITRPR